MSHPAWLRCLRRRRRSPQPARCSERFGHRPSPAARQWPDRLRRFCRAALPARAPPRTARRICNPEDPGRRLGAATRQRPDRQAGAAAAGQAHPRMPHPAWLRCLRRRRRGPQPTRCSGRSGHRPSPAARQWPDRLRRLCRAALPARAPPRTARRICNVPGIPAAAPARPRRFTDLPRPRRPPAITQPPPRLRRNPGAPSAHAVPRHSIAPAAPSPAPSPAPRPGRPNSQSSPPGPPRRTRRPAHKGGPRRPACAAPAPGRRRAPPQPGSSPTSRGEPTWTPQPAPPSRRPHAT